MDFIYLYENRTKKPLIIALSKVGRGLRGRDDEAMQIMYNIISLTGIVTMNPPHNEYILIKNLLKKKKV
jgi:hypothetical protein